VDNWPTKVPTASICHDISNPSCFRMPVHGDLRIVLQMGHASSDHLPDVHTCFGLGCVRLQKYVSFEQLSSKLLMAAAESNTYEVA
jgi:hypothetical protein